MAKSLRTPRIGLRAIIYQEDGFWLAHCLEMDIVAEGATRQEAMKSLEDLCMLQIRVALEQGDLESIFRAAPPSVWKMYTLGEEKEMPRKVIKPVDRFEVRELEIS